jgi:hypothetical protein
MLEVLEQAAGLCRYRDLCTAMARTGQDTIEKKRGGLCAKVEVVRAVRAGSLMG